MRGVEIAYLALVLIAFGGFALTLAWARHKTESKR